MARYAGGGKKSVESCRSIDVLHTAPMGRRHRRKTPPDGWLPPNRGDLFAAAFPNSLPTEMRPLP